MNDMAGIIIASLDAAQRHIENLPDHASYTKAFGYIDKAKAEIQKGRDKLHG